MTEKELNEIYKEHLSSNPAVSKGQKEYEENLGINADRAQELSIKIYKWMDETDDFSTMDILIKILSICETKAEVAFLTHGCTLYLTKQYNYQQ